MSHPESLVAVLDANVLYPQWLRDLLLTLAALGYYEPRWSDRDRHLSSGQLRTDGTLGTVGTVRCGGQA